MPPKTTSNEDDHLNNVLTLCHLMSTCVEFKADLNAMQEVLGLAQSKNVPRKINSIINPHGFELKGGKVIEKEDNVEPPATPVRAARTGVTKNATPKTPTSAAQIPSKAKKVNGASNDTEKKTGAKKLALSKKRKFEAIDDGTNAEDDHDAIDEVQEEGKKDVKKNVKKTGKAKAKNGGSDDAANGETDEEDDDAKESIDEKVDGAFKSDDEA